MLSSEPEADLSAVKGLGRYGHPPDNRGLKAAIHEGIRSGPVTRPRPIRGEEKLSPAERERVMTRSKGLKTWRSQLGKELSMDSSLLWPAVSLERLARRPSGLHSELVSPEVRSWQKREFSSALRRVLATLS